MRKSRMFRFGTDDFSDEEKDVHHEIFGGTDEMSCGCCGWECAYLFVISDTEENARKMLLDGTAGLCGECIADVIVDGNYELTREDRDVQDSEEN